MAFTRSATVTTATAVTALIAAATLTLITPATSFAVASSSAASSSATSSSATAAKQAAAVICPMEVVRSTRRHFPTKTGWGWSNFFRKGSTVRVYQGETRKIADGLVVVKTTTVVGDTRFWVDQRDITRAGACMS
ncbi:hypothetical protein [Nonomuraea sp. NPDC049504]|uniref:hypothetical protein n=1 Tax=Nonomuraea sp. NPDC049504 TaxID=3154729 RepID=UPI003424384F